MASTVSLAPNGAKAALLSRAHSAGGRQRGVVSGWTAKAARRNRDFLWSIHCDQIPGQAVSVTLTVRDLPASAVEWQNLRKIFFQRMRDSKRVIAFHWVCEWQVRSWAAEGRLVPHLHAAFMVAVDPESFCRFVISVWLELSAPFRSGVNGQHAVVIWDLRHWLQYLAKHASRGSAHYQRQLSAIPKGWEKSGRLWGYGGAWPRSEPLKVVLEDAAFFRLRRVFRRYEAANLRTLSVRAARKDQSKLAVQYDRAAHAALRRHQSKNGESTRLIPVASWIPLDVSGRVTEWVMGMGCEGVLVATEKFTVPIRNPRPEYPEEVRAFQRPQPKFPSRFEGSPAVRTSKDSLRTRKEI